MTGEKGLIDRYVLDADAALAIFGYFDSVHQQHWIPVWKQFENAIDIYSHLE